MSMRLKGLLLNSYQSQVEHSYLHGADVLVLKDVPCEMTFESAQGFIDHENEQHDYLPVFHLMGYITGITGDFPYHISSIYFDDTDKAHLAKDCLYYPSPEELAHMIKTGKYFSKHFTIPEILDRNTYSFPARVNLTIIPPPNPEAYENSVLTGTLDGDDIDRLNLPIVYVGLLGTGINRKNDKLLDYYGIDLDLDFATFALTAESSGYTDPPLMNYILEPKMPEEVAAVDMSEYYITDEDEKEMLDTGKSDEQEYVAQEPEMDAYPEVDLETVIVAQADRAIERRLEDQKLAEQQAEVGVESDIESKESPESQDDYLDTADEMQDEQILDPEKSGIDVPEEHKTVEVSFGQEDMKDDEDKLDPDESDILENPDSDSVEDLNGADVEDAQAQTKVDEARSKEQLKNAGIDKIEDQLEDQKQKTRALPDLPSSSVNLDDDSLDLI